MRKKLVLSLSLALALSLAVLATGCGGDDEASGDGDSSTATSLTKAEYVKQASAICVQSDKRALKKFQAFQKGRKANEETFIAMRSQVLEPEIETQIDELGALPAPEGEEDQIEALLDELQGGLEIATKPTVQDPFVFVKKFQRYDDLAEDYGLDACFIDVARQAQSRN